MTRLAIVTTHPIQYNAPLFRALAANPDVKIRVFYTWQGGSGAKFDPGFGKTIAWDVDLLSGYDYVFVRNTSTNAGSHHYKGIVNPSLCTDIEAWQADCVLVYGWKFHSHWRVLRYFRGKIPVFFRGDSTLIGIQGGIKGFIKRQVLRFVYRHIDTAFYVGYNNRQYFKYFGVKDEKLHFAPHSVDNDFFTKQHAERNLLAQAKKKAFNINDDIFTLIFAAKFEPKKNPLLLIDAVKELSSEMPLQCIFVGNGALETAMRHRADGCKAIFFVPFQNQSEMPVVYRMGDVYVLPSQGASETWGLAMNEAMACGCAILASNEVGGAADMVKTGENGYVFQSGNKEDLKQKIRLLVSNAVALNNMKKQSLQLVQQYSIEKTAQAITQRISLIAKSR